MRFIIYFIYKFLKLCEIKKLKVIIINTNNRKTYFIDKLCDTDMLAVEINISFYDFFVKSDSKHVEYFLLLYNVYVFSESISNFSSSTYSLFKNLKHQENNLMNLRKNKKFDQNL